MKNRESLSDMAYFDVRKISEFYEHYIHNLNQETLNMEKRTENSSKEELIEMLSDPHRLKEAFEQSENDLVETANDINDFYSEFDDGMSSVFELTEDPVVKKIKQNLKLKNGVFNG